MNPIVKESGTRAARVTRRRSASALARSPADVETVIVGGDVVKRDGKLAGDHVDHALELMHATREHLRG